MDASSLPVWAQAAGMIAIAMVAAVIGVIKYIKTESKVDVTTPTTTSSVISASFTDAKLLRELIEALRDLNEEQGRDTKKTHRLLQDLKEALNELNEATIVQTDTTLNLVRFINRETKKRSSEAIL